ncbi:hypothetical protein HAX54_028070 [Datura stramonium]|uniref:DUF676 domain-containing protein n=1 Tax=Datura stramonium TaxID=4076 RepID=A0ABS8S9A8_DATST|nr:hypothetical protein [Datura stramonium]
MYMEYGGLMIQISSFSTQPFESNIQRQDILLSMMVSFNLSLSKHEGSSTSGVILGELFYAPILENGNSLQASLDACPASTGRFECAQQPFEKSRCPLLLCRRYQASLSVDEDNDNEDCDQAKQEMLIKALSSARDILFEELQNISKAINQSIDFTDFTSKFDGKQGSQFPPTADTDLMNDKAKREEPSKMLNGTEKLEDGVLQSQCKDDLIPAVSFPWQPSLLLMEYVYEVSQETHKTSIMDFLREQWAIDRRAEWSIWMPAQTAAMRAELHRKSIAQMRINSRSIQDMQIFGDPSRIPIVIVERVVNAPLRSTSGNSYFIHREPKDANSLLVETHSKGTKKIHGGSPCQNGRVLKIVVFVHGFQGHHLDLRLVSEPVAQLDPKVGVSYVRKLMKKKQQETLEMESIMEPYLRFLHTYVSVSGPHLGYLYSSNSLFNSGLWLLKKLKGTPCMHQHLPMIDLRDTFLYKLCKGYGIVVLILVEGIGQQSK